MKDHKEKGATQLASEDKLVGNIGQIVESSGIPAANEPLRELKSEPCSHTREKLKNKCSAKFTQSVTRKNESRNLRYVAVLTVTILISSLSLAATNSHVKNECATAERST